MSSPGRRISVASPKKRLSVASQQNFSMAFNSEGSGTSKWKVLANTMGGNANIVREHNRADNLAQDKDIEIERLRTTAHALNQQVDITEDIKHQNYSLSNESKVLKERVAHQIGQLSAKNMQIKTLQK